MARYGCTITVQTGEMPSTQTNFIWVAVTANFPTVAIDGGSKSILNGGGNLRFYTDDTKTTRLPLGIVKITTGSSPSVLVWGLASILSVGDTVYIEADNVATSQPSSASTYGRNEVWADREYHYNLYDNTSILDSTGNVVSQTVNGSPANNQTTPMGSGVNFTFGDSIIISPKKLGGTTGNLTLRAWVNPTASERFAPIIHLTGTNVWTYQWRLERLDPAILIGSSSPNSPGSSLSTGTWVQLTLTVSGTTISYYRNGVLQGTQSVSGTRNNISSADLVIGANIDNQQSVVGSLAGVSASFNVPSAAQVESEYNNQSNPAAFWSTSAWEDQDIGVTIIPASIPSGESFGTPTIITGVVLIAPVAVATQESVGSPSILTERFISPSTIPSEESVGDPVIELILQQIFPNGIPTEEFVGRPAVLGGARIVIPILSRQTWNSVAKYLRRLVFKGADNDVIVAWFRSEGLEGGTHNDLWYNYLLQNGFLDGSLTDKYASWRQNLAGDDPWLLSDGNWNDTKIWIDDETWRDN